MTKTATADQSNSDVIKKMLAPLRLRKFTVFPGPMWLKLLTSATPSSASELMDLQEPLISCIALQPEFLALLESIDKYHPLEIIQKSRDIIFLQNTGKDIVHTIFRRLVNVDLKMEKALMSLRKAYLQFVCTKPASVLPEHIKTMASIASQSFNNEYVFFQTAEEEDICRNLFAAGGSDDSVDLSFVSRFVAYAMYHPVSSLSLSEPQLQALSKYDEDVQGLIEQQIVDGELEAKIAVDIPSFCFIEDAVSLKVRQQYEESPYPRWIDFVELEPGQFSTYIKNKFSFLADVRSVGTLDCLVAGCGTGLHALKVASKFADSSVVAVDLSRRSLAYGVRQAARCGVSNVEFWHGDILEIDALQRDFDLIESVGVLHHMDDPARGLRALAAVLRPGGFMKIAVYRRSFQDRLKLAKEFVRARLKSFAVTDLRAARHELIAQTSIDIESSKSVSDFYITSEFRDLLCHVQETSFTPLGIKELLRETDLSFLGIDYGDNPDLKAAFLAEYPGESSLSDLAVCEEFEASRPELMPSLIKFWVRKI